MLVPRLHLQLPTAMSGEQLRKAIAQLGLSANKAAPVIGVSRRQLTRYLAAAQVPRKIELAVAGLQKR